MSRAGWIIARPQGTAPPLRSLGDLAPIPTRLVFHQGGDGVE
jgi:hypothetical protein